MYGLARANRIRKCNHSWRYIIHLLSISCLKHLMSIEQHKLEPRPYIYCWVYGLVLVGIIKVMVIWLSISEYVKFKFYKSLTFEYIMENTILKIYSILHSVCMLFLEFWRNCSELYNFWYAYQVTQIVRYVFSKPQSTQIKHKFRCTLVFLAKAHYMIWRGWEIYENREFIYHLSI